MSCNVLKVHISVIQELCLLRSLVSYLSMYDTYFMKLPEETPRRLSWLC